MTQKQLDNNQHSRAVGDVSTEPLNVILQPGAANWASRTETETY